jgi:hypothetical protein
MMIDTRTTARIPIGAGYGKPFDDVGGDTAKPKLPRLLAEIEAANDETGHEIECSGQQIGAAQAQGLKNGAAGERP